MIHASLSGRFAPLAYFKAVSWLDQTSPPTLDIKNHYTKNTGQPKTSTGHVKALGGKNGPPWYQQCRKNNQPPAETAKTPTSCVCFFVCLLFVFIKRLW